jgi:hypothetical protein
MTYGIYIYKRRKKMKSKMFKKLMASVLAVTMTAGLAACGNGGDGSTDAGASGSEESKSSNVASSSDTGSSVASSEESSPYPILKDANGNVYDLGGMEIVIRDWWTDPDAPKVEQGKYADAQDEWREWIQETYNFKIVQKQISGWGSTPEDYTTYVRDGGDENNYVWVLRQDSSITGQINSGFMYDLATLDCLDFSSDKLAMNGVATTYSKGNSIYCMYAGASEPRGGVYFNKTLLQLADMTADDLYDLQKNKQWTWAKMEEIMKKVQKDTDGDGIIDVYGCDANNGDLVTCAIYANKGYGVKATANGYELGLRDPNTMEALEWCDKIYNTYWYADDVAWDTYKSAFKTGKYLFMFEQAWAGQGQGYLNTQDENDERDVAMTDEWGFLCFPIAPKADNYIMVHANNPVAIPSCYDKDRAWKIAFAWNLYTDTVPGWDDSDDDSWKAGYIGTFDQRSVDESLAMMRMSAVGQVEAVLPGFGYSSPLEGESSCFMWSWGPGNDKPSTIVDTWFDKLNAGLQELNK